MMDKPEAPQHVELRSVSSPSSNSNTTHVVSINDVNSANETARYDGETSIDPPNSGYRKTGGHCSNMLMITAFFTMFVIILVLVKGQARTWRQIGYLRLPMSKQPRPRLESDPRSDPITRMVREKQPKFRDSGFAEFNDEPSYRESLGSVKLL